MSQSLRISLVVISLALLTTAGDYCLKLASKEDRIVGKWLITGCAIYVMTAFGWVWTMRHVKLATLGAVYSVLMVLFLALLGSLFFKEALNRYEVIGISLALASIVMLARFAE